MYIRNGSTHPSQLFPTEFLPGDFVGGPSTSVVVVSHRASDRDTPPTDIAQALEEALGSPNSVWDSLAERYDVRHMSLEEMERLSYELFLAGAISAREYILLSSPPSDLNHWRRSAKREPHDWVAAYEGVVANCCLRQEQERFEINNKLLEYLERLEEAAQHP